MLYGYDADLETLPEGLLRALRLAFLRAARREADPRELEATAHHVEAFAADYDFARMIVARQQLRLPVEV